MDSKLNMMKVEIKLFESMEEKMKIVPLKQSNRKIETSNYDLKERFCTKNVDQVFGTR
jgi:hypothetical protein